MLGEKITYSVALPRCIRIRRDMNDFRCWFVITLESRAMVMRWLGRSYMST